MRFALFLFFLMGLIINFTFLDALPIFANTYEQKDIAHIQLAEKYCDSIGKNLFTGLDKESTLKYEYFFSGIPENSIEDRNQYLDKFRSDVKSICSYEMSKSNETEFKSFLKNYFKTRSSTPKIKVEATNPTLTNPAIIPVLR